MVILILERVTPALRGELSRWLIQPRTGVFVGKVSALVRDKLWQKVVTAMAALPQRKSGSKPGAMMVFNAVGEQGFDIKLAGQTDRIVEDFEGLLLVKTRPRE